MNNDELKEYLLETLDAVETLARSFRSSLGGKPGPNGTRTIDAREVQAQLAASEKTVADIATRLRAK